MHSYSYDRLSQTALGSSSKALGARFAPTPGRFLVAVSCCLWVLFSGEIRADTLAGRVVRISDGDTLTLLTPQRVEVRVRLAEIDAPEKSQPFGQRSKQMLSELVFGQVIHVDVQSTDRYQREIGTVFLNGKNINLMMVLSGYAWCYRQYAKDPVYCSAERDARQTGRGLWQLQPDQRIPPWEFRHLR